MDVKFYHLSFIRILFVMTVSIDRFYEWNKNNFAAWIEAREIIPAL